jgi:MFS family permease
VGQGGRALSARIAWSLWALTVVALVTTLALPSDPDGDNLSTLLAFSLFVLSFMTVGALVASRRPGNPLGWILCCAGVAYAVAGVSASYAGSIEGGEAGRELLTALADWFSGWAWMAGIGPAVTFLLLLFPTGRLPGPGWRPVAWVAAGALAAVVFGLALSPELETETGRSNPLAVEGAEIVAAIGAFLLIPAALASIASVGLRFRRAAPEERRQLKWLAYTGAVVAVLALAILVAESTVGTSDEFSNTFVSVAIAALPVSIGIAILRHGLFDIDVVINRTLVYGALTATLAGAYLATVLLLQLALSPVTEQSDLAIAGSTLAVAALFRPARAGIQELVDRRFYRRRYDAARTLEAFGVRARDELDLEALAAELRGVVSETVQPREVSLWLR